MSLTYPKGMDVTCISGGATKDLAKEFQKISSIIQLKLETLPLQDDGLEVFYMVLDARLQEVNKP